MKKTIEQAVRKAARASGGDMSAMIAAGVKAGIEEAVRVVAVTSMAAEPEPVPRPNLTALAMDYFEAGDKVCVHTLEKTDNLAPALPDGPFSVTLTLEVQGTL